jgi:hypothetical protein
MVSRVSQKMRGTPHRSKKPMILFGVEGNNKTEKQYFMQCGRMQDKFIIRWARGNETDPVGIVTNIKNEIQKIEFQQNDKAFAIFDVDMNTSKVPVIQQARELAKKQNIELILSNPCFEVWFVLHFEESMAPYDSNSKVIDRLKQYVHDYEKSADIFSKIRENMLEAVSRAENLRVYHDQNGTISLSDQNPMTEVDRVVKLLVVTS